MIFLRSLLFNLVMFGVGAGLSVLARLARPFRPGLVLALGQCWARATLAALRAVCGIRVELSGRAYLPAGGAALIAAQHQSAFDTVVWLTLLPKPAYVLKQELLRMPLMGPLMLPSGFIAVDREGGAAALRKMLGDCRKAAAEGRQIVIFPEGTRVAPGARVELQPGVVALAKTLKLPIIPAATDSGRCWGRRAFSKFPGRVAIKLFPAIGPMGERDELLARLAWCFYEAGVDKSVE